MADTHAAQKLVDAAHLPALRALPEYTLPVERVLLETTHV